MKITVSSLFCFVFLGAVVVGCGDAARSSSNGGVLRPDAIAEYEADVAADGRKYGTKPNGRRRDETGTTPAGNLFGSE